VRRSDVVSVMLVNFKTEQFLANTLEDSMVYELKIPVTGGAVDLTQYSLVCKQWKNENWVQDTCSEETLMDSDAVIMCKCSELRYTAVFQGPVIVVTTQSPEIDTTQADVDSVSAEESHTDSPTTEDVDDVTIITNETATTEKSDKDPITTQKPDEEDPVTKSADIDANTEEVKIQLTINADYDTVVTDKEEFLTDLKAQLVSNLDVEENQIINLDVTKGSIIVAFDLINTESGTQISTAVDTLLAKVNSDEFNIEIDGQTLSVDKSSIQVQEITATADDDGLAAGEIVGIVIGVLLLIVIIAALILLFIKYNNQKLRVHADGESQDGSYSRQDNESPRDTPRHQGRKKSSVRPDDSELHDGRGSRSSTGSRLMLLPGSAGTEENQHI